MKTSLKSVVFSAALPLLILPGPGARAQTPVIPESITTPDKVETRIGDLDFRDGYPTTETAKKIQDELDYLYPYVPGGYGTSVGSYLNGEGPMAKSAEPKSPRFVEGSGMVINTIPPNDFGHYELLNEMVQREPASALDPELAGQFAMIGIVKGQEFAPDARMKKILNQAVAFGNAASRTLGMAALPKDSMRYYEGSAWCKEMQE